MEHMRHASALERLTAGDWEEVLNEVIAANEDVAQPPPLQDGTPLEAVPELDEVERGVLIKVNNQINNEKNLHVESSWRIPWFFHIRSRGR